MRSLTQQTRPGYSEGFARSTGESANPGLWKSLQLAYHFPLGNTGNNIHDVSGKGNNGVLSGSSPEYIMTSKGLGFDSSGGDAQDVVAITGKLANVSGNVTTLSTWVKINGYDANGFVAFGTNTGGNVWWQVGNSNTICYIHGSAVTYTETILDDNTWRHLVFVSDGVGRQFYVNGALLGSTGSVGTALSSGGKNFHVGGWIGGSSWELEGQMLNSLFWDRALTP